MNHNKTLNKIVEIVKNSGSQKNCIVLSHQNPDGDTLGSMLTIGEVLRMLGHNVDRVVSDPVPEIYKFLPFANLVKAPCDSSLHEKYDLAFSLDCGSDKRLGSAVKFWQSAGSTINIDHHISNEKFGIYNWIEPNAVSTGQVVFWLAKSLKINITSELATLFYITLLTDTGCFSNSNTTAEALLWGAELIKLGADHLSIYQRVFLEKPFITLKAFGMVLSNLSLLENGNIAFAYIDHETMKNLSATSADTEDVADYMKRIKGVKISIFLREDSKRETKVSFRSNNEFDVSKIAASLGGGGHKRAAGANIKFPLNEAREIIVNKVLEEFKKF